MKLLDSQIGNFLVGKFGGMEAVDELIEKGQLILAPISDCRGTDLSGKIGVYMTEAQNTTVDIMQLVLQRVGSNCKVIIEGDDKAQVDLNAYSNGNNGLRKASQVFRGQDYYGEITLNACHRSKIARQAELMT
jgi:predicted ribonuclease YlaK